MENENTNGTEDVKATAEETAAKAKSVAEEAKNTAKTATKAASEVAESASRTFNEAFKQVEKQMGNLSKALGSALQDRANVVMDRVNDDSLHYLDMLVEADITKSRSESAAFLINEGIKANEALFNKIREITDQISALKVQLKETVHIEE